MEQTRRLAADATGIAEAARLLRAGENVAFPTETVYGLGGMATNAQAIAGIFEAKGRPSLNPLIIHVTSLDQAARYATLSDQVRRLAEAFWPGPLTLVLPLRIPSEVASGVTAGLSSIAVRWPSHPLAQQLITAVDAPVAAPSANPSGRISPTTAEHVLSGLQGRIAAVLDGGPCKVGLESTILDMTETPRLLRAGGLPIEAIETVLGRSLAPAADKQPERPKAPGMLSSHYAPRAQVRLNATTLEPGETRLGFGAGPETWTLSADGDLGEAATNLFGVLHAMDHAGVAKIAVAPIPEHGLGLAINDRLRRAAAPRP